MKKNMWSLVALLAALMAVWWSFRQADRVRQMQKAVPAVAQTNQSENGWGVVPESVATIPEMATTNSTEAASNEAVTVQTNNTLALDFQDFKFGSK